MTASLIHYTPRATDTTPAGASGTVSGSASGLASGSVIPVAGRWRKAFGALVRLGAAVVMGVAVAAFLFLAVGPRVLGYQTSTMLTGSMSPLINPGDVVITAPSPVSGLRTGDVITYRIPVEDQRVETHRVIEIIRDSDGTTAVRTKGDANNGPDPWTAVLKGDTVDVQTATIPFLGTAIRTLRDPMVLNSLMYGAPAVLSIILLTSIWRKTPEAKNEAGSPGDERSHA
jgi:signal peptidase I